MKAGKFSKYTDVNEIFSIIFGHGIKNMLLPFITLKEDTLVINLIELFNFKHLLG